MTEEVDISEYDLSDAEKDVLINAHDAYPFKPEGTSLRISTSTEMGTFNALVAKGIMSTNGGRPDVFLSPTGVRLRQILREERGLYVFEPDAD